MRVVTYNFLCEGSPTRDAWKAVNRLKPDVLRGQECRNRLRVIRSGPVSEAQAQAARADACGGPAIATPYHCDGIVAPGSWRPRLVRCEVIAGPVWEVLSDHNPVVAALV